MNNLLAIAAQNTIVAAILAILVYGLRKRCQEPIRAYDARPRQLGSRFPPASPLGGAII
jgi:hypothetical protein